MMKSSQNGMFQKTRLENGIKVVTEKMPHVRSVCIGIWVPTGSRHEAPEKNGISHFVEHMLFKGTDTRTSLDISTAVDSLGGEINAFTSREMTTYYIKVLDEHLDVALDILSDIFLHSLFDKKELEKERQVILEEIRMQEDQPEDHVHDLIQEVVWPNQPLGFPVAGREESVSSINREGIIDFIEKRYSQKGIVISCAGNIEHEACVQAIDQGFRDYTSVPGPSPLKPPTYHSGTRVINKDLEQVHLCLSLPGLRQNHPDRYAFYALNTILGTNMSSRLFQEVREKRGMAYSVFSYLSSYIDSGSLTIYTGTGREKIRAVIEVIRNQLDDLSSQPVSDQELSKAKEYMKGGLMLSLESSSSVMSRIAKQTLYFESYQSVDDMVQEIEGVTSEKILELASGSFRGDQLSMAAIGPIQKEELSS
jgi:predicted Zn-dependent peptidase